MFGANHLTPNIRLAGKEMHHCRKQGQNSEHHQTDNASSDKVGNSCVLPARRVGINSAFDLRQSLLMFVHHAYHCDRTTNQNCDDPYEKYPKTENSVDHFHACLRSFVLADDRKPTTNDGTGGADRDRTGGLLVANQALSQLSYSPDLVGLGRLELPTSRLSGVRSSHLSYRPGGSKISRPFRSPKFFSS